MKNIYTQIVITFLIVNSVKAQQQNCPADKISNPSGECWEKQCIEPTTALGGNWNWSHQLYWDLFPETNFAVTNRDNFPAPWNGDGRPGNPNSDNPNLNMILQSPIITHKPEDGWEIIKKDFGIVNARATNPSIVLYNKFRGILRVFVLRSQKFGEASVLNVSDKGAIITVSFISDGQFGYKSNLLQLADSPLNPLEKFNPSLIFSTPQYTFDGYHWLYADFPMMYDPCTCENYDQFGVPQEGGIRIDIALLNSTNISMKINSVPLESNKQPYGSNKVNGAGNGFLHGIKELGEGTSSVLKKTSDAVSAISDIGTSINTIANQDTKFPKVSEKLKADLELLKKGVSVTKQMVGLIPVIGTAASTVLSLVDFFTGGGGSSSTPSGPAPMYIVNNFKAEGTLTSYSPNKPIQFAIPGSNQTGIEAGKIPIYNNTLGIFNLLKTPKVRIYTYTIPLTPSGVSLIGTEHRYYKLDEQVQYVVNPAAGFDLSKSSIVSTLVFEDAAQKCTYASSPFISDNQIEQIINAPSADNLTLEAVSNGNLLKRTSYYKIGCINESTAWFTNAFGTYRYRIGKGQVSINYDCRAYRPKVFLKVAAKFHVPGQDEPVEFIGKFKVDIVEQSISSKMSSGVEDLPEVLTIGGFTTSTSISIQALDEIVINGNISTTNGAKVYITAPRVVQIDGELSQEVVISGQDVRPMSCDNYYPPASNSQIEAVCNSNSGLYKSAGGRGLSSRKEILADSTIGTTQIDAFPNPTSGITDFHYQIKEDGKVKITLMDIFGRTVATVFDSNQKYGTYNMSFDCSNLINGLYLYTLETDSGVKISKRLVVNK